VAVDANADSLRRTAWRAARRDSRGGAGNLLCVAATPAELSRELPSVADRVTIVLPWGALLPAVAAPEPETLLAISEICAPGASFEVVFSRDPRRDAATAALPPLYDLSAASVRAHLQEHYGRAGLQVRQVEELDQKALLDYPTTWAKRLAHGRPRKVWRVRGFRSSRV
jgi:hypothetical protein